MNMKGSRLYIRAIAGTGDNRLHTQSSKRMRVLMLDGVAGLHRLVGDAVSGAHEVAGEFCFQHFDLRKPLDGSRTDPTGNESAGGKSVALSQWRAIHVGGDECIGV